MLFDRQIAFLDALASRIRARNDAPINRAQLIRALIDAVADSDLDLSVARSEADLKKTLLARLRSSRV